VLLGVSTKDGGHINNAKDYKNQLKQIQARAAISPNTSPNKPIILLG